jgi:hypothetical protein
MNQQEANLALFTMGQDGQDDEKPSVDVPDPLAKFLETAELRAALRGGNVEALAAETADIDANAARVYQTIAKKAEAATLAKSAGDVRMGCATERRTGHTHRENGLPVRCDRLR